MRRLPWADVHEREREQEVILELCVISFFLFQKVLLLHCFFFFTGARCVGQGSEEPIAVVPHLSGSNDRLTS